MKSQKLPTCNMVGNIEMYPFTLILYCLARAAYAGAVAVKKLVADAQKLPSRNRCCQDYKKIGSFKEAEQDFDKLNPQDVRRFQFPDGVRIRLCGINSINVFHGIKEYKRPLISAISSCIC